MGSGAAAAAHPPAPPVLYSARAAALPRPSGCLRAVPFPTQISAPIPAPFSEPCRGCRAAAVCGWRCSPSAWGRRRRRLREGAKGSGAEGRTGGRRRPPRCRKPPPRRASVSTGTGCGAGAGAGQLRVPDAGGGPRCCLGWSCPARTLGETKLCFLSPPSPLRRDLLWQWTVLPDKPAVGAHLPGEHVGLYLLRWKQRV